MIDDELPDFLSEDACERAPVPAEAVALSLRLGGDDADDVLAAIAEVQSAALGALQADIARLLLRADLLGPSGVERVLDCLEAIGDGRCVRPMEEALHRGRHALSEHQGWRARRIVQKIRRFGRR